MTSLVIRLVFFEETLRIALELTGGGVEIGEVLAPEVQILVSIRPLMLMEQSHSMSKLVHKLGPAYLHLPK